MTARLFLTYAFLTGMVVASSPIARAQFGLPGSNEGTISGVGVVQIKKLPERMRLQVELLAKGKTLPEALARLNDRRTAVTAQVKALGAAAETIELGEARIAAGQDNQRQMMEMMVRQRMAAGRSKAKPKPVSMPVTVSSRLTAEWPLRPGTADVLLLATHALQEKIKAADLAGTKDAEQLTPEEQELSEELAGAEQSFMYGQQEAKPGTPLFVFLAPISETERAAAAREAFQKAKESATRLAVAAGSELGPLRSLHGQAQVAEDDSMDATSRYAMQMMRQQMPGAWGVPSDDAQDAWGTQTGTVSLHVTVTASFALK